MKTGRWRLPTPPVCSLAASVRRLPSRGLQLSISIIISRLLVYRFDNVPACTARYSGRGPQSLPQSVRLMGAGRAMGARRPSGLGVKNRPSAAFEGFDPSLRSICELVLGPTYASVPTVTKTHDRNMTVCRPKSGGKISPCSKNTRSQKNSCWNTSIIRKEWWHHDRPHSLWRPCLLVVWSVDH